MAWTPQSQVWPTDRAVLLVHGIGNAREGDYQELLGGLRAALGPDADSVAIYQLFYDQVNDWFTGKTQLGSVLQSAISTVSNRINDAEIGHVIAELLGDVLWPVLSTDARAAVREVYLAQLQQMVADGTAAGLPARDQRLSIICHSLGCFHTYEALHHAALYPSYLLQPASHGVRFDNVICMASPVQMIRSIADAMGGLVPNKRWLYCVKDGPLTIPSETKLTGGTVRSVRRWISIAGDLDPVGGYFFRQRSDWAFMQVDGQEPPIVDSQDALGINDKAQLRTLLSSSLRSGQPPNIAANNPHSWERYVAGHASDLRAWLT